MGLYDEITINDVTWQTKGLGKGLKRLVPGDRATVRRAALSAEEYSISYTYIYDDLPPRYLVRVHAVEYLLIENGRITGLATEADQAELVNECFDVYGRSEHDQMTHDLGIFEPRRPRRTYHPDPREQP